MQCWEAEREAIASFCLDKEIYYLSGMKKLLLIALLVYFKQVNAQCSLTLSSATICYEQQTATLIVSGATSYTWMPAISLSADTGATVLGNPSVTTIYTVTGTTGTCTATNTTTITVNPLPTLSYVSYPGCAGQTLGYAIIYGANILNCPNCGGVNLYGDTLGGILNTTTSYTIIATDSNGCVNIIAPIIVVNPLPIIGVTPVNPSICNSGAGINLYANGAQTYAWTNAPNYLDANGDSVWVNPSSLSPPQAFIYSVTGTDINSCVSLPVVDTIKVITCPLPYQKLLADSVTEFDVVQFCAVARLSNPNQTLNNCINIGGCTGAAWYAKNDSLYKSKAYKKVTVFGSFQGLIREDTILRKVYFIPYCDTTEDLLYDFSLLEGNTINYTFPNLSGGSGFIHSGTFTIDSIRLKDDYHSYYPDTFI
jgi:hypothetical protein